MTPTTKSAKEKAMDYIYKDTSYVSPIESKALDIAISQTLKEEREKIREWIINKANIELLATRKILKRFDKEFPLKEAENNEGG